MKPRVYKRDLFSDPGSHAVAPAAAEVVPQNAARTTIPDICREAVRWTFQEDLPNLREISLQRVREGTITRAEHSEKFGKLESMARRQVTESKCRTSTGKDREVFQCLGSGGGLVLCTGALGDAMNRAVQPK